MLTRLTRMEKDISKLQEKEELIPLDRKKIRRLKGLDKEHDREFEDRHVEVLNFIAAKAIVVLESEDAVIDAHMDHVTEFLEQLELLQDLVGTTKPVMPHTSNKGDGRAEVNSISELEHLSRRLSQVQDSSMKVKRVALEDKETDMCQLESHEKKLKSINTDLQGIKCDILLIYHYAILAGRADGLKEALFELQVSIKCLRSVCGPQYNIVQLNQPDTPKCKVQVVMYKIVESWCIFGQQQSLTKTQPPRLKIPSTFFPEKTQKNVLDLDVKQGFISIVVVKLGCIKFISVVAVSKALFLRFISKWALIYKAFSIAL